MDPLVLTYSSIQSFLNCRRSYYYRNVAQLVSIHRKPSLSIGTAIHRGIQTGSIDDALATFGGVFPSSQEEADELEIRKATVEAMLEGYFARFEEPNSNFVWHEVGFEVPLRSPASKRKTNRILLAGKVDGVEYDDQGGRWLLELKTASQIDRSYVERLELDRQVTTYVYGLQRRYGYAVHGVLYRVLRKPTIRPRKGESIPQFCDRLTEDYRSRPEFYFAEERLHRSPADLKEFEAELWETAKDIRSARKVPSLAPWYRNTSRCGEWGGCAYLPLCRGVEGAVELYRVEAPHSELEEGENGDGASNHGTRCAATGTGQAAGWETPAHAVAAG